MDTYGWNRNEVRLRYSSCYADIQEDLEMLRKIEEGSSDYLQAASTIEDLEYLTPHRDAYGIGMEQVLADLYAIKNGGSVYGKYIDEIILDRFGRVFNFMESESINWFRGTRDGIR